MSDVEDESEEPLRPADDPQLRRHQRVRQKQIIMALGVYLSAILPFAYIHHLGMLNATTDLVVAVLIGALLTNGIFLLLIHTRINLLFRDPSMTMPQVLIACGWATLAAWNMAQPARLFAVILFLLAFLFGIYTLRLRQFLFLTAIVVLAYSSVVIKEYVISDGGARFRLELLHAVVLTTGLVWTSFVGGYVSNLRRRLAAQRRELSAVAFIDPLTDLHNRRYVTEALERELARIERMKVRTLSVALIDVDHFKRVNDSFGHDVGDKMLVQLAEVFSDEMRRMDTVGRFGGEEFIILMPDTDLGGAAIAMERLRRRVEGMPGPANGVEMTVSIGITEYRSGDSIERLLRRADQAMYVAKEGGRNRVECFAMQRSADGNTWEDSGEPG